MTVQAKVVGLTVLILAMVAGMWGAGFLWHGKSEPLTAASDKIGLKMGATTTKGAELLIENATSPAAIMFFEKHDISF